MLPITRLADRPILRFVPLLALALVFAFATHAAAYSVLTHEQIVDLAWKDHIVPLLLHRFPHATPEQLREAHAHAYGGSLVHDMGYYPFGNQHFSDLVHYVRSGDFIVNLVRESQDINEYAFALGALAHYASDIAGHPAVNSAVAIEFPKLRARFGDHVTYEDDPKAHIRTEFGFDVVQVAKNRYTSDAYHDFVGFSIAKPLLERAFLDTYGIELSDLIKNEDRAVGTFRFAVGNLVPKATKVALEWRRDQIVREYPSFSKTKFLYYLSRAQYEKEWGKDYKRPGFGTRLLAFLMRIVPKVGPFKALALKDPTPQTEEMYLRSVDASVEQYFALLRQAGSGTLQLPDKDFDTGRLTRAAEYKLTDRSYALLLRKLAEHNFDRLTADLRDNILQFYGNLSADFDTKRDPDQWKQVLANLERLKSASTVQAASSETPKP
ncbi:MAG: zinc dependent phospholipase C family protein [Terriglobales bacterium]